MTRTAGILKNSSPNPPEITHSNKHTHYFAQQAEYFNPNTPPSRDISVSTSFHKPERPRTPTKSTSNSKRRTPRIITAAMAKRELPPVDKSDKAGPSKKQKITPAAEALDSDSERESPEVHMEEQPEASDASNDGEQQEASDAPDNDNADTAADGNAKASVPSKKPKARPIAECFTPFDVQPSKIAPAGTSVLDFWGIKPRTKDARPQDLHADQPSARESGGQTNPPLWEDRKWRFRTPNRMVKWVGHEAPDGLDEENAPDIDQEANLIYPLLNMAKKSKNSNPRRELTYYFYEHGVPKDWNDKQAVKALNDRRVQSIERICVDPPWTVMERDYLAQLLADHPDASIWELTQWHNDYFIGEYTEDTGLATDEETSLFLSSGRTIESVRAQYMLYKVSYDKGLSPTGVREKKDKTDLGKARQKDMERRFGKPNAGDGSGDDSDNDSDDDSGDGPGDEGEKKAPKKKLDKKPSKPKGPTPDKKMPTTKKPAAKTEEATDTKKRATKAKKEKLEPTFYVSEDDTYESRFARYSSTTYTRDMLWNEILARNLHSKPTKSSVKSVKAAALARDDMAKKAALEDADSSSSSSDEPAPKDPKATKKAARKDRAIKSGTTKKKPQQIIDSDDESDGEQAPLPVATFVPCVGEELAVQTAASDAYKLQPKLGDLDEEMAELGGAYHPHELRAETPPPPPPQRYMSFSSISDFSESPSDIASRKRKADDSDSDISSKRRRSDRSASIDESDDALGTPMVTDPKKVQERRTIAAAKTRVVEKKAGVQKKAFVAQAVEKVVKKMAKKAVAEKTVKKTVETKKAVVAAPPVAPAPAPKAIRSVEIDEENYDDEDDEEMDDAEMLDVEGEFQLSPSDEEMEREVRGN